MPDQNFFVGLRLGLSCLHGNHLVAELGAVSPTVAGNLAVVSAFQFQNAEHVALNLLAGSRSQSDELQFFVFFREFFTQKWQFQISRPKIMTPF